MTDQNIQDSVNREFKEREAKQLSQKWNLPYIDLINFPLNPEVLSLLPVEEARKAGMIPFFKSGFKLRLAVFDYENKYIQSFLNIWKKQGYVPEVYICSRDGFELIFKNYRSNLINKKTVEKKEVFEENKSQNFESEEDNLKLLGEKLQDLRSGEALNEIEIQAIKLKCSDIHLQPYENKAVLRFRINGILHDICEIPRERAERIVTRIKYNAGMKSNIYNIPQDGHLSFKANDRDIDLRVSTLPTEYFESVVMRVLDSSKGILSFEALGFQKDVITIMEKNLKRKNGMILVTGPTGSGKTTTLYSMLDQLNTEDKKLVTLEDPIEYHIENITQSQVNENSDYNFATGLKALLRHDPDVVLIGEIRELSTAKLATEASLTGHIVLSSLHTNSAVGAITRLKNLGLEDFNIASSVNIVLAQRLVRKVCHNCYDVGKTSELGQEENEKITGIIKKLILKFPEILEQNLELKNIESAPLKRKSPKGCTVCSHTGYTGQTVVSEVIDFTDALRESISQEKTEHQLLQEIQENQTHFLTLFEDGIRKVIIGETTLDEIYRVVG